MSKIEFANTLSLSLGTTAASVMNTCEKFGMAYGFHENCPQLINEKCQIYSSVEDYLIQSEDKNERIYSNN